MRIAAGPACGRNAMPEVRDPSTPILAMMCSCDRKSNISGVILGRMTRVPDSARGGRGLRAFAITPAGMFFYGQNENNLVCFYPINGSDCDENAGKRLVAGFPPVS